MDEQLQEQQEQKQEVRQEKKQEVNVEELIRQKLDEEAKALGFDSWDDMQSKLLEEKGRLYELLEKTKKELNEKEQSYKQEIEKLRKQHEETLLSYEVKSRLSGKAIDAEKAYKLFRAEHKVYVKDGKVYANGEEIEKAIEKFLNENPFLLKPSEAQGAGTSHKTEQAELPPEERIKQAFKKLLGGR
ncbi:hypothetical protein [Hydrogenobacter thermophilus]|uniref:hypothetical protein n=1 Tax=Hydrogenobacter thermophilus TaxID=940 RepID=UPI0030FC9C2F